MKKYYVYAYLREDRYTPYYIGKGTLRRVYQTHERVRRPRDRSRISIVKEFAEEQDALDCEVALIKFWGRKKYGGGVLYNTAEGGSSGPTGMIHNEDTRKLMSEKVRAAYARGAYENRPNPSKALKRAYAEGRRKRGHSEETKQLLRDNNHMSVPVELCGRRWKSQSEAGREFGVCAATIRNWVRKGHIPAKYL